MARTNFKRRNVKIAINIPRATKYPKATIITQAEIESKPLTKREIKRIRFMRRWEKNLVDFKNSLTGQISLMKAIELPNNIILEFKQRYGTVIREAHKSYQNKMKEYDKLNG